MTRTEIAAERFVATVATEMAAGIDRAVERWIAEVDAVLQDSRLTSLGRLNALRDIVQTYKHLTGKEHLEHRVA